MSSTLLYLAIVAVWAVVLVPMYLRRDTDNAGIARLLHRRPELPEHETDAGDLMIGDEPAHPDATAHEPADGVHDYDDGLDDETEDLDGLGGPAARRRRAAVIARRRRRTFLLTVAMVAAGIVVATRLAPWWVALPPVGMFVFHLALLRVAVGMDAAQRLRAVQARAQARLEHRAAEQARLAEEAAKAEIIDLAERAKARDVFDQYARDERGEDGVARAVGD